MPNLIHRQGAADRMVQGSNLNFKEVLPYGLKNIIHACISYVQLRAVPGIHQSRAARFLP